MKSFLIAFLIAISSLAQAQPIGEVGPNEDPYECAFVTKSGDMGVLYVTVKKGTALDTINNAATQTCTLHLDVKCVASCRLIDDLPSEDDVLEKLTPTEQPTPQPKGVRPDPSQPQDFV